MELYQAGKSVEEILNADIQHPPISQTQNACLKTSMVLNS
jgi:hypothetical protein